MVDPSPSSEQKPTTITDLDMDSLAPIASRLNLRDLSIMAMSCKYLKRIAYSDSVWHSLFRERWPPPIPYFCSQTSSVREAYLTRLATLQQFKFEDPLVADFYCDLKSHDLILLDKNEIIFSQGPLINMLNIDSFLNGIDSVATLGDHRARLTCMRGHNGEVTTLSDKLLGDGNGTIFASGGVDGTVRLWSLNLSGKRGQHALKATLYGHEKPVVLMSVAGHKSSLLVSLSRDSKVRVWDTSTSSAARSSCCVGMTSLRGAPVGLKCHESFLYAGAGSSVVSIDLRTLQKVFSVVLPTEIYSFDILPSKSLISTGGNGSAMLWDMRRSSETIRAKPMAVLDGHAGPVKLLHMDAYKIVTGGPDDSCVNVWEAHTGELTNSLMCSPSYPNPGFGCLAMAVEGCRIVTASSDGLVGLYATGISTMLLIMHHLIPACLLLNSGVHNLTVILRDQTDSIAEEPWP